MSRNMRVGNIILLSFYFLCCCDFSKGENDHENGDEEHYPLSKVVDSYKSLKDKINSLITDDSYKGYLFEACGGRDFLATRVFWSLVESCQIFEGDHAKVKIDCRFPKLEVGGYLTKETLALPLLQIKLGNKIFETMEDFSTRCKCGVDDPPCECDDSCAPHSSYKDLEIERIMTALSAAGASLREIKLIVDELRGTGQIKEESLLGLSLDPINEPTEGSAESVNVNEGSEFKYFAIRGKKEALETEGSAESDDEDNQFHAVRGKREVLETSGIDGDYKNGGSGTSQSFLQTGDIVVTSENEINYHDIFEEEQFIKVDKNFHSERSDENKEGYDSKNFLKVDKTSYENYSGSKSFETANGNEDHYHGGEGHYSQEPKGHLEDTEKNQREVHQNSVEYHERKVKTLEVEEHTIGKYKEEYNKKYTESQEPEKFETMRNADNGVQKDNFEKHQEKEDDNVINRVLNKGHGEMETMDNSETAKSLYSLFNSNFQTLFVRVNDDANIDNPIRAYLLIKWWRENDCLRIFPSLEIDAKEIAFVDAEICRKTSENKVEEKTLIKLSLFEETFLLRRIDEEYQEDLIRKEYDSVTLYYDDKEVLTFALRSTSTPLNVAPVMTNENITFGNERNKELRNEILRKAYTGETFPVVKRTSNQEYTLESEILSASGILNKDVWEFKKYISESWAFHNFKSKIFYALNFLTSRLLLDFKSIAKHIKILNAPSIALWIARLQINDTEKINQEFKKKSVFPKLLVKVHGGIDFEEPLVFTFEWEAVPEQLSDFGFIIAFDYTVCHSSAFTFSVFRGDFDNRFTRDLQVFNLAIKFDACEDSSDYDFTIYAKGTKEILEKFTKDYWAYISLIWDSIAEMGIEEWVQEEYRETISEFIEKHILAQPQWFNWIPRNLPWYNGYAIREKVDRVLRFLEHFGSVETVHAEDHFRLQSHVRIVKVVNYLFDKTDLILDAFFPLEKY